MTHWASSSSQVNPSILMSTWRLSTLPSRYPYNRLVTGLEPDNFRIFENSVEQEIQYFSSGDIPISIGVVFDLSGSMANKVDKAREAASQFFNTSFNNSQTPWTKICKKPRFTSLGK
jgi:hypothetical protein